LVADHAQQWSDTRTGCLIYFRDGDTDHLVELPFDPEERCEAPATAARPAASSNRRRAETTLSVVRDNPDCRWTA
jgi:hypothetical protein